MSAPSSLSDYVEVNVTLLGAKLATSISTSLTSAGRASAALCHSEQPRSRPSYVMMPEMDGFEVCRRSSPTPPPRIFPSSMGHRPLRVPPTG